MTENPGISNKVAIISIKSWYFNPKSLLFQIRFEVFVIPRAMLEIFGISLKERNFLRFFIFQFYERY